MYTLTLKMFNCMLTEKKDYLVGALWLGAILQLKDLPVNSTYDYAENCGANNYPQTKLPEAASKPSIKSVYILGGTIVASSGVAIIITTLFVDDILEDDQDGKPARRAKITLKSISKREYIKSKLELIYRFKFLKFFQTCSATLNYLLNMSV